MHEEKSLGRPFRNDEHVPHLVKEDLEVDVVDWGGEFLVLVFIIPSAQVFVDRILYVFSAPRDDT